MEKRAILVKQVDALSNNQLIIQMFTIGDEAPDIAHTSICY